MPLKLIALGDTHGRNNWKQIIGSNEFDKIIFLGDYFDTHESVPIEVQIVNFKEIIQYKKMSCEKVVLLLGNHDYHYLDPTSEKYTGYQREYENEISDLLIDALDEKLIQIAYVWQRLLFTHAGLTKTWCRDNLIDLKDLENSINSLFVSAPEAFEFTSGIFESPTGDDLTQSPIWVRPDSLLQNKLDKYIQIVGHTPQQDLTILKDVAFIDSLGTSGEFLVIENNVLRSGP